MSALSVETMVELTDQVGREYGIEPWALMGHADKESSFRPAVATGGGKHVGLMQIDKGLVQSFFPGQSPLDPLVNLRAGAKYLRQLQGKFGSRDLALAAYNWGETKLRALLKKYKARTYEDIKSRLPLSVRWYVSRVDSLAGKYRDYWVNA